MTPREEMELRLDSLENYDNRDLDLEEDLSDEDRIEIIAYRLRHEMCGKFERGLVHCWRPSAERSIRRRWLDGVETCYYQALPTISIDENKCFASWSEWLTENFRRFDRE